MHLFAGTRPAYMPKLIELALVAIMLALVLGRFSPVAVREMRTECRNEPQSLGLNSGRHLALNSRGPHLVNEQRQQCQLEMGDVRVPLPAWGVPHIW